MGACVCKKLVAGCCMGFLGLCAVLILSAGNSNLPDLLHSKLAEIPIAGNEAAACNACQLRSDALKAAFVTVPPSSLPKCLATFNCILPFHHFDVLLCDSSRRCENCSAGFLDYSLNVATKMLPLYERIFAEPFPLPKLDFVSIPDFSAGGMENFGLIIIQDTAILIDPEAPAVSDQLDVAVTVVHEMCHQVSVQP